MTNNISQIESDIKAAARDFAHKEFEKARSSYTQDIITVRDLYKKACTLGLIGTTIEENYGGAGIGLIGQAIIAEEFWKHDPEYGLILLGAFGSELVQLFGTSQQKNYILPKIVAGEWITAVAGFEANSEHNFVYDVYKGYHVLNGESSFVINAPYADIFLVVAYHSATRKPGIFWITKDEIAETFVYKEKLYGGILEIGRIKLNKLQVEKERLIGEIEDHTESLLFLMNVRKVYATSFALGAIEGCLQHSVRYVRNRTQFGRPIGAFPLVQEKIGKLYILFDMLRCYFHEQLRLHGLLKSFSSPLVKLNAAAAFAKQLAVEASSVAVQLHGGYGFTCDFPLERYYRNVQLLLQWDGPSHEDTIKVAKEAFGLMEG